MRIPWLQKWLQKKKPDLELTLSSNNVLYTGFVNVGELYIAPPGKEAVSVFKGA